jgi:hypothetical protein
MRLTNKFKNGRVYNLGCDELLAKLNLNGYCEGVSYDWINDEVIIMVSEKENDESDS